MANTITDIQRDMLLDILKTRFEHIPAHHPGIAWPDVLEKLGAAPEILAALYAMEETGGEPNVVTDPANPSAIVFMDCAAESPVGRRSLCYDQETLLSRKSNPPRDSAEHMAAAMGIALLSETQYRALQSVGEFDLKTSSWVKTPEAVRAQGGALFCDRRYGQVFLFHNGADAYYGSRGFRGYIIL